MKLENWKYKELKNISQEVRQNVFVVLGFGTFWHRLENTKLFVKLLRYFHYRSNIIAPVTVVWRWPNSHQISWSEPKLETLLNQLMCSCYQLYSIDVVEVSYDLCSENPTSASVVRRPSFDILGIWPH